MRSNRLAGHVLPDEGRVFNAIGQRVRYGKARCSCGEESTRIYVTTANRQQWHREHKDEIRAKASGGDGDV